MWKKIICIGVLWAIVFSTTADSEAARRRRRGRSSRRSSSTARIKRYLQARQKQIQNYQRLMAQRQQALAKEHAEKLTRLRKASVIRRQREAESRERRKETLQQKRERHQRDERAAGTPHGSPEALLKNYDKNRDGVLSKLEVGKSPLSMRFTKTDTNNDGKLTLEELRAAKSSAASKRPTNKKK